MAEVERCITVYLGDSLDDSEQQRQKEIGGRWTAHCLAYDGGEATSWCLHSGEWGEGETLTEHDIVHATADAVNQRLHIDEPNVRYVMPSVGTLYGVQFSRGIDIR